MKLKMSVYEVAYTMWNPWSFLVIAQSDGAGPQGSQAKVFPTSFHLAMAGIELRAVCTQFMNSAIDLELFAQESRLWYTLWNYNDRIKKSL